MTQTAPQEAPPVQFATTPDGVRIAYSIRGDGLPVIYLPFHFNHLEFRWRLAWLKDVSRNARVVAYDGREQGLSSRHLDKGISLTDYRVDLETVIEAVGFERFVLVAYGGFAHVAVGYAVDNPERVKGLVLICTAESFSAYPWNAMLPLVEENWDLFLRLQTENVPLAIVENLIHDFKTATTPAEFTRMIRAFSSSDIADLLPRLRTPTLMIHSRRQHWLSPEEGARTAAKIAGARIFFPDGETEPEPTQGASIIVDFLKDLPAFESKSGAGRPSRLAVALSARQRDVLRCIAEGKTTREIAEELVLSERTVERHIADVYAKIGARNRAEATSYALSSFLD